MKKTKSVIIVLAAVMVVYALPALAVMRVPIPKSSSMQPVPYVNVKPNVSGNINWSSQTNSPVSNTEGQSSPTGQNQAADSQSRPNQNFLPMFILFVSIGLLVFAAIIKISHKNNL